MLIYHNKNIASNIFGSNLKRNKVKSRKKQYKSIRKSAPGLIRVKPFERKQQKKVKKNKVQRKKQSKKRLSQKNKKFLEELGLKVKPLN